MKSEYKILGLMSGTSLDGLDIAICRFNEIGNIWNYSIEYTETIDYSDSWKSKLTTPHLLKSIDLIRLDREYGIFIGKMVAETLKKTGFKPQLIASHGHTVFHSPSSGITLQIGHGAYISSVTGLPVVCDLRSTDIALGGQGAPLVPMGDKLLFSEYQACLNLGGFANISFDVNGLRRAFDICPVNIILNRLAKSFRLTFDKDGLIGKKGRLNEILLEKLNNIDFYQLEPPKSLSREWLEEIFIPIIESVDCSEYDKCHTIYHHIAFQLTRIIGQFSLQSVLLTGGGAHNKYLMELIKNNTNSKIIIPDIRIVDFKEAIIFAFLGLLRYLNRTNCLASVTGASRDSSCGAIYDT